MAMTASNQDAGNQNDLDNDASPSRHSPMRPSIELPSTDTGDQTALPQVADDDSNVVDASSNLDTEIQLSPRSGTNNNSTGSTTISEINEEEGSTTISEIDEEEEATGEVEVPYNASDTNGDSTTQHPVGEQSTDDLDDLGRRYQQTRQRMRETQEAIQESQQFVTRTNRRLQEGTQQSHGSVQLLQVAHNLQQDIVRLQQERSQALQEQMDLIVQQIPPDRREEWLQRYQHDFPQNDDDEVDEDNEEQNDRRLQWRQQHQPVRNFHGLDVTMASERREQLERRRRRLFVFRRFMRVIAYPFTVILSIVTIILLLIFCILPTIIGIVVSICLYYCLIDDPIPIHLLLRYMFSPDSGEGDTFHSGPEPTLADRKMVESKLIVRRLEKVTSTTKKDSGNTDEHEEDITHDSTNYPRNHPRSIRVLTGSSCLHFSEPVIVDEGSDSKQESRDENGGNTRQGSVGREEESSSPSGGSGTINEISIIPHYQRSFEHSTSNEEQGLHARPINHTRTSSDLEQIATIEQDGSAMDDDDEGDGTNEESGDDEGNTEINVGMGNEHVGRSNDIGDENPPSQVTDNQNADEANTVGKTNSDDPKPSASSVPFETDYFGLDVDCRDKGTTCDICLLSYEVGDEVAWSPNPECTHTYHKDCVLDWLQRKSTCPICRRDYLKESADNNV